MRVPPESMLRRLLTKFSAESTAKALRRLGYDYRLGTLRQLRAILLATGEAQPLVPKLATPIIRDPVETAKIGSDDLERAIKALYVRTAERHGCSLTTAHIMLNYSPEQIRKMAA